MRADLREVLATGAGRRYLWHVLDRCHLYEPIFTGTSEIYLREGKRQVALSIKQDIEGIDPRAYLQVLNEMALLPEVETEAEEDDDDDEAS